VDSFNPTTKTQAALTSALQAATAAGNRRSVRPPVDGTAHFRTMALPPHYLRRRRRSSDYPHEAERLIDRLPSASGSASTPQLSR